MSVPIQHITQQNGVSLYIKREDLIHPFISGNKWWKLKYNMEEARKQGKDTLLTFGGAYSNHIYALAAAAKEQGFKSIGIIRGEELNEENSTLAFAKEAGMKLVFISREAYRKKNEPEFLEELKSRYKHPYIVPEGGTNDFAVKGCEEIVAGLDQEYDIFCCPVGTGGTLAGITAGLKGKKKVIGFSSLKNGDFLKEEVRNLLDNAGYSFNNFDLITDYHFGGYGKVTTELVDFINKFKAEYNIQLEPVYTGKMLFGIFELIKSGYFSQGTRILTIHTGGLQGLEGFKTKYNFI